MNDATLSSYNPFRFGKNLSISKKMSISKKIKAINNKSEQNKALYHSDRQTAKIFALSSGNVNF